MSLDVYGPLMSELGHVFDHPQHLQQALTLPCYANEYKVPSMKPLALLGDKVIGLLLVETGQAQELDNAENSRILQNRASNRYFASLANGLGLQELVKRGGATPDGERLSDKVMGDVFEAVVCAVYRDAGLEAARSVVNRLVLQSEPGIH